MVHSWRIKLALSVWCSASGLYAAQPADLYRETIQPTLKQHCLGCHGEGEFLGKLDLRSREGLVKGGSRGPAIVPGNARASLLYRVLEHSGELRMPPTGRLPDEAVAAIRDWIDGGAAFAELQEQAGLDWGTFNEEDLWAFRPIKKIKAPGGIDSLLRRKLVEAEITPAPRADRRTLIRRATMDLTGLPPTPEQVEAFVADPAVSA